MGMSCDRKPIVFTTKTPEVTQGGQDYGKIIWPSGFLEIFFLFPRFENRCHICSENGYLICFKDL